MSERWKTMKEILAEAHDPPASFTPEEERQMLFRARLMARLRERVTQGDAPSVCHVVVTVQPDPAAPRQFVVFKNRTPPGGADGG